MKKLAIVSLLYLEPEYKQTLSSIRDSGYLDVFFANRDGVGNMSRAFNDTFKRHVQGRFEFVWFITDVRFLPSAPEALLALMESSNYAVLHPACRTSDHLHLRPQWDSTVARHWQVPFVELMAPIFRTKQFAHVGMFPEDCWYWYMDLAVSYELKRQGYLVGCTDVALVEHIYLRDKGVTNPITRIRKELREVMKRQGLDYMLVKYGKDWRQLVGWKE